MFKNLMQKVNHFDPKTGLVLAEITSIGVWSFS